MPFVKSELCIGCGTCVQECPNGAIYMKDDIAVIDQAKCTQCGTCVGVCPQEAIRPNSEQIQPKNIGAGRMHGHGGGGRGGGRGGGCCYR